MGIDDDIWVFLSRECLGEHITKRCAAKGREAREWEIENSAWSNISCLGIHHVAEVKELDVLALERRRIADSLQVGFLVDANLTGDDCSHEKFLARAGYSIEGRSP